MKLRDRPPDAPGYMTTKTRLTGADRIKRGRARRERFAAQSIAAAIGKP